MRLIDADALFPYGSVPYVENDGFATADILYGIIKNAPTVDAIPVVRCEDCAKRKTDACSMYYELNGKSYSWEGNDDFCSRGERKEKKL